MRPQKPSQATQQSACLKRENDRLYGLREVAHRLTKRTCHEIRSPLTVIKTFSSVLLSELPADTDTEHFRFLRAIVRCVDDIDNLADAVLDASQLATDRVGSRRQESSLADLVEDLLSRLEHMAASHEVTFSLDFSSTIPAVFCDQENIGRVIRNLCARAFKAAGRGGSVELWARYEPEACAVRIGITDDRINPPLAEVQPALDPVYSQVAPSEWDRPRPDLAFHVLTELVRINLGELSVTTHPWGGSTSAFTLLPMDLDRIISAHLGVLATGFQMMTSLSVALAAVALPCSEQRSTEIVQVLWSGLREDDLVVPVGPGAWALIVACNESEFPKILRRVADASASRGSSGPDCAAPGLSLRAVGSWPLSVPSEQVAAAVNRALSAPRARLGERGTCETNPAQSIILR